MLHFNHITIGYSLCVSTHMHLLCRTLAHLLYKFCRHICYGNLINISTDACQHLNIKVEKLIEIFQVV